MAVVRCPQGHYYDDERFSSCPHCGIFAPGKNSEESGHGPEKEKRRGIFGWLDREKTVAYSSGKEKERQGESDRTIALEKAAETDDQVRTVGIFSGAKGNDYVTGWLVCVEGPEKGRDYRLHHGFNRLGRSLEMDLQVRDDPAISRDCHFSVVYDGKTKTFSVVPGNASLTYCKGKLLSQPGLLQEGEEITAGGSRFVFVPFCREGRGWEEEGKS